MPCVPVSEIKGLKNILNIWDYFKEILNFSREKYI
jgi:hypothetical protein